MIFSVFILLYISIGIFVSIHHFYKWKRLFNRCGKFEIIFFAIFLFLNIITWPVDMIVDGNLFNKPVEDETNETDN